MTNSLEKYTLVSMKLSNVLSGSRIIMAVVFLLIFFLPHWFAAIDEKVIIIILIPLFALLEITDYFDGKVARRTNSVSDFGKHFDPFCDALANLTIMFCFVLDDFLPPILYLVILYREFGITFLRMLASQHKFTIPAKMGGKVKTVMYIFSAGFSLLIKLLEAYALVSSSTARILRLVNLAFYCIAITMAVITFVNYLVDYRRILAQANDPHNRIE